MSQNPAEEIDHGNELAEGLATLVERLRPYRGMITTLLLGGAAALVAWTLFSSQMAATRAQSWDAYLAALSTGNPASFEEVIKRYPDSPAANWSRLVIAELLLREGTDLAFSDRARSRSRLEASAEFYSTVLRTKPRGLLAERATFGLAKARESLGRLDEALDGYKTVAAEFPYGGLAELAGEHANALGLESTRQWYDWFESQDVAAKPAAEKKPAAEDATKADEAATPEEAAKAEEAAPQADKAEPAAKEPVPAGK